MKSFERLARHLVPAALAGLAICAAAAPKSGPIDEATCRTHIARLSSDEFEGRKPGTDAEKRTLGYLEAVGYGVTAPESGWDDYAGVDMRGKTAVILVNDPGFVTDDASLFRGRAMTYY